MIEKKPCEIPSARTKLDCFAPGEKKCYGHLLYGCKWGSAKPIISLSKCPWRDRVKADLAKKGVEI